MTYKIHTHIVCRWFFAKALGGSVKIVSKIRDRVIDQPTVQNVRDMSVRTSTQYDLCTAFWSEFFDAHCQSPREGVRLFPVNMSMSSIYSIYFVQYFEQTRLKQTTDSTTSTPITMAETPITMADNTTTSIPPSCSHDILFLMHEI